MAGAGGTRRRVHRSKLWEKDPWLSTRSTSWVSLRTLATYDADALEPPPPWSSSSREDTGSGCEVASQRRAAASVGAGLVGETLCPTAATSRVKRTKRRPGVGSRPSLV